MASAAGLFTCVAAVLLLSLPGDRCVEIIGGQEAKPHSWPYMALVQKNGSFCGGALIKEQWVLTAAHCGGENMKVTLGAHSRTQKEKVKQHFAVTQTIPHPKFNTKTGKNDLMLLKLKAPAKLNKYVAKLNLSNKMKDVKAKTPCKVAGWGVSKVGSNTASDKLMEAEISIVDRKQCQKFYKSSITKSMLCAWGEHGKKDTCQGDSGGPMICDNQFSAVTSFGQKCGAAPGVYTMLKDYIKWINKVTGGAQ